MFSVMSGAYCSEFITSSAWPDIKFNTAHAPWCSVVRDKKSFAWWDDKEGEMAGNLLFVTSKSFPLLTDCKCILGKPWEDR